MFYSEFVDVLVIYFHIEFHVPSSSGSLVIIVRLEINGS